MKKKILAFIFSLCLIIPCMFIFSACGDEPPADDPTKWKTVTEATCTTEGLKKRTIDGNEETEKIPALGHNYSSWNVTLNETCTTNGSKQQTCERCNDVKTETILAHHTLDGTTKFDATHHWEHCTKCTEKVNAEEHDLEIISTPNNLLFDACRYIGEYQHITCNDCGIEIDKDVFITNTEGTISSSSIEDVASIYTIGGSGANAIKFHFYDFMRNTPIELSYDKYFRIGIYTLYVHDDNYNITYNNEEKTITYLFANEDLVGYTTHKGIRVYLDNNNEPQRVAVILKTGEEFENGACYQIETNENSITYKLYAEANNTLYSSYTFDNNYNLINYYYNNNGGIEYSYTYDEYGFLTKVVNNTSDVVEEEFKNCTYDNNGNRTGFDYYVSNEFKYSVRATFNTKNQIISVHYDYPTNNLISHYSSSDTEFVYDNNGKMCGFNREATFYNSSTSTEETRTKSYICQYTDNSFKIIEADNAESYFLVEWQEIVTTNIPE